jgi:ribosome-binding factor A
MNPIRKKRIEGEIQKNLSLMLINGLVKDPLLLDGLITITEAQVSNDFEFCKVFVSIFETEENSQKKIIRGLYRAAPYMQHLLGQNLRIRRIPKLKFFISNALEEGDKMVDFLNSESE